MNAHWQQRLSGSSAQSYQASIDAAQIMRPVPPFPQQQRLEGVVKPVEPATLRQPFRAKAASPAPPPQHYDGPQWGQLSRTVGLSSSMVSHNGQQHNQPQHNSNGHTVRNETDHLLEGIVQSALGRSSEVWRTGQQAATLNGHVPADLLANPQQFSAGDVAKAVTQLAKSGAFQEALDLITECTLLNRTDILELISHKQFMRHAELHKASKAAVGFLHALPKRYHDIRLYNMVLMVCAASRDLEGGMSTVTLADKHRFHVDTKMLTTLIKVCKSVGNADKAFNIFNDMKRQNIPLDGHVYGALVSAFAEAMQREQNVVHERKEQFVLLERAFNILKDAEDNGVKFNNIPWNSLLACAGRCGQLKRAFEILDLMRERAITVDVYTYGSLMEACVQAKRPELALRVFQRALMEGYSDHVEIYTQALSACKVDGAVDLDKALEIYNQMQRKGVAPDKKFYSALIGVAGKAGKLDLGIELLADMTAEGIGVSPSICSALLYACLNDIKAPVSRLELGRKVYDLCAAQGVYPLVSQYNRMMDWYASLHHFGDVASLLSDMVRAGLTPNLNTYRVLLNACQRCDQAQLAFEVYAVMKAKKLPILQQKFAQTIYFTLLKSCFNMIRHEWAAQDPTKPAPWQGSQRPVLRLQEADQVLRSLGTSLEQRGKNSLLVQQVDSYTWVQLAVGTYRDMVARGHKPGYEVLDMVLGCLRLYLEKEVEWNPAEGYSHLFQQSSGSNINGHEAWEIHNAAQQQPKRTTAQKYETTFEWRAVTLLEDAISRGFVPSFQSEQATTLDMRNMLPCLAEVYTLLVLNHFEKRAAHAAHRGSMPAFSTMTILVPRFNPDLTNWPSYVEKVTMHFENVVEGGKRPSYGIYAHESMVDESSSSTDDPESSRSIEDGDQEEGHSRSHSRDAGPSETTIPSRSSGNTSTSNATSSAAAHVPEQGHEQMAESAESAPNSYDLFSRDDASFNEGLLQLGDDGEDALLGYDMFSRSVSNSSASSSTARATSSTSTSEELQSTATSTTGLAVAATCRRMKFYAAMDPVKGVITMDAREIARWVKNKQRFAMRNEAESAQTASSSSTMASSSTAYSAHVGTSVTPAYSLGQPRFAAGGFGPSSLAEQQRNIRLGGAPVHGHAAASPFSPPTGFDPSKPGSNVPAGAGHTAGQGHPSKFKPYRPAAEPHGTGSSTSSNAAGSRKPSPEGHTPSSSSSSKAAYRSGSSAEQQPVQQQARTVTPGPEPQA